MDSTQWLRVLEESLVSVTTTVIGYLPLLAGAALLLLAGWLLARLSRAAAAALVRAGLNRLDRTAVIRDGIQRAGLSQFLPGGVGAFVYWAVLLIFFAAAIESLQLTILGELFAQVAAHLPNFFLGAVMIVFGLVGGNIARHAIAAGAASAGLMFGEPLARFARAAILVAAIVLAADQVGIRSTLLEFTFVIVLASTLGGGALAFAIGSSPTVSNILASYYLRKTYRVGQTIQVGADQGEILEITSTGVLLETSEGRVFVPARKFGEESSILLRAVSG